MGHQEECKTKMLQGFQSQKLCSLYVNNSKARMTGYLFSKFLHHFDMHIKAKKNHLVLLFMDNVLSHFPDVDLECVKLHHLPPKCTSHLQPLHAGVVRSFKAIYRQHQVRQLIELLEQHKPADINHSVHYPGMEDCHPFNHEELLEAHWHTAAAAGKQ